MNNDSRTDALETTGVEGAGIPSGRAAATVSKSAQEAEVAQQAVLDLGHVVPRQVVHELADHVRDVDSADLIDQDLGLPSRYDYFRPEHGRLSTG